MVDENCEEVKKHSRGHAAVIAWVECHPRTGWYIVAVSTLNAVLNFLGLFH